MSLCLWVQEGDGSKPVTDQWLPPFVIVGDDGKPVGTIEVSPQSLACANEVSAIFKSSLHLANHAIRLFPALAISQHARLIALETAHVEVCEQQL